MSSGNDDILVDAVIGLGKESQAPRHCWGDRNAWTACISEHASLRWRARLLSESAYDCRGILYHSQNRRIDGFVPSACVIAL